MAKKHSDAFTTAKKLGHPALPFPVGDRGAFIRKAAVALELVQVPTLRVATFNLAYGRVEVIDIPVSRISQDANTQDQYYVDGNHTDGGPPHMAKIHLSWLRRQALEGGATLDAIQLLSKATGAFTKKEEKEMAEKLKAKGAAKAPKAANTDELKTAAKAAPVAKADTATKKRGNPEALAKARAAKSTGPDTRKIKPLVKAKDLAARAGTFRRRMLEDLLSSKTVDEWRKKDNAYNASCLKFAVDNGMVSVS